MQKIQIEEPGSNNEERDEEIIIGIDLGTTNSLAIWYEKETLPKILVDVFPSTVTFFEDGSIEIGKPQNINLGKGITVTSVKRKVGKDSQQIEIYGKVFSPEEISALILIYIKEKCEEKLKRKITKSIITVPAYFDDTQRSSTKKAAEMAGLSVVRLLNEPTAAAIFYDIENSEEGIYAIFDLGGGTFDVSILQMKSGVIKVIGVGGDANLGGDDFDSILGHHLGVTPWQARQIKEELCSTGLYEGELGKLNLDEFDELILPIIHRIIRLFREAVESAACYISDIKSIILVGGSTRMPIIKEALKHEFNINLFENSDVDRIVAYGAALHAYNLQNRVGNLLLDAVPLSLGIETGEGLFLKIIPRNSSIPIEKTEEFTTSENNQTGIVIHVLQGERELAKDCRSLATFNLTDIPPLPKGEANVLVNFKVDIDGILEVSAFEMASGKGSKIEVRPTYQLRLSDVRNIFQEAMKHGKEDVQRRLKIQRQAEANDILESAKAYSSTNKTNALEALILKLEKAISSESEVASIIDEIRLAITNGTGDLEKDK